MNSSNNKPGCINLVKRETKVLAFYLPQFHRIKENSEWWGPGFTEWTNVVKAKPNYIGHYQPHFPRDLGFYDLSHTETLKEQSELAKAYGIDGFCIYYYWFSGRKLLEKPLQNLLCSDIDISFCLCWANENWTRTWDGDSKSVLMQQEYRDDDPVRFIESILPYLKDKRYIRVNNKPMLIVYRAKQIPNPKAVFNNWRDIVTHEGLDGLHIVAVEYHDISTPEEVGADALLEFPPHRFSGPGAKCDFPFHLVNSSFNGEILDYLKIIAQSVNRTVPKFALYRGIMPSWDNTARRQENPSIVHGSSPLLFTYWLRYLRCYAATTYQKDKDDFIFINAWNEWGEGCHLEPDQKYGLQYLEAVRNSKLERDIKTSTMDQCRELLYDSISKYYKVDDGSDANKSRGSVEVLRKIKKLPTIIQRIAYYTRNIPYFNKLGKLIYRNIGRIF
ncbi:glycosyl hydrolase [Acidithiobacillus sp. CV18-2]|nr:glycosyl hydrolase [Acidithiobacillus sp. CV18-3]MBU2756302.1 glycosyl hydrolase [Acidithiobacillus sp. BN09-2]MBU2775923.1 glycosyl hydrolase [Acidithiobacillus sp. CV18-2]MBU2799123.1 glycosyl hydrolase [Acidithiobacillus sp. VAN18-4]